MSVIDADTHIDETDATWEYILDAALKPTTVGPKNPDPSRPPTRYWEIGGKRQLRFIRDDVKTGTKVEQRELLDVPARLRHMDELGVEVQVIYPTMFLAAFTENPELDYALRRSYNRWLAERCEQSRGRLRWVCLPPLLKPDKIEEELRFAKDHGACGVLKKGDREADKWVADPYFHPTYELAEKLDMPICFHQGSGVPDFSPVKEFTYGQFYRITLPVVHAFHTLILHGIPEKFPKLRFGFIEAAATWVPYALYELRRRLAKNQPGISVLDNLNQFSMRDDTLKANRFYVSVQVDEDLPYLMKQTGEDNLVVGSDYSHADWFRELGYRQRLQERVAGGDITDKAVAKMTFDNVKALYGL